VRAVVALVRAVVALALAACGHPAGSARTCDPRSFGARGDGATKDSAAIQAALDACGTVELRGGTFVSGTLRLHAHQTLRVERDATLLGTQDPADYPDLEPPSHNSQLHNCRKALLYGERADGIVITGSGTIDGNGGAKHWLGPAKTNPERTRPMAIFVVASKGVTIEDVAVKNAAMWAVVTMESDDVAIRRIQVDTPFGGTRDGIDVVDDHRVVIEDSTVSSEDDSICLKSGSEYGTRDVTVRNCRVRGSKVANGLKLGTASVGAFEHVVFEHISLEHVDKAGLAVESVDGSAIRDVVFRDIEMRDVGTPVFVLLGARGDSTRIGTIDDVRFEHVHGDAARHDWGSIVSGVSGHPAGHVRFSDVRVVVRGGRSDVPDSPPDYAGQYPDPNLWGAVPAYGLYVRLADVELADTTFTAREPDARPATSLP